MKILHTADWHLGKKLDFYSRMEEQKAVMQEICQIAEEEDVDLVIVAGDLFDAFNPPTEAVDLLYKTLKRLADNGKRPVVAIAGNHDSPHLIDAPDPLARECGIILIGHPNAVVRPLSLSGFHIVQTAPGLMELELKSLDYPVRILHTAYANEVRLKEYLGENKEEALNKVLAGHWEKTAAAYCDQKGVNILTAHLYMMKKGEELLEEPDGEKPIRIGNADLVYSDAVPEQIKYTALGHLHGYRNVGTLAHPVIYASSPLQYSFSEAGQQKAVSLVELQPGEKASVRKIPLRQGKQLVRKTFDTVEEALQWLRAHPQTLVELTMESNTFLSASDQKRLYEAHRGIIYLIPKIIEQETPASASKEIDLRKDIRTLFKDYFKSKKDGQDPNEEIMKLFDEIVRK